MDSEKGVKRILHIVSAMDRGGAETLIMNVYRKLDKTKIQFDFIVHGADKGDYEDEIKAMGGKIYRIPSLGTVGAISYVNKLIKIMKHQRFIAVHSHTDYQSGFPALAAKIAGINQRICHSHSTNWLKGNGFKETLVLIILKMLIKFFATSFSSCSKEAAIFLFGEEIYKGRKFSLLKNGIDVTQFTNEKAQSRRRILQEFSFPDNAIIIGHVGRFSESKNHSFFLKVVQKLVEEDNRFVAILVGEGPLKEKVAAEARKLGIGSHIRFSGVRSDIPVLMGAFDVFLFPSLFEGFGIVTIEAQCAGTPCIVSDSIPRETDLGLGLVSYIPLNSRLDFWVKEVKNALSNVKQPSKQEILNQITRRGYNICESVSEWLRLYGIRTC